MRDSKSKNQGSAVDFGTSPHGLSAELLRTIEETRCAEGSQSLVDGSSGSQSGASQTEPAPVVFRRADVRSCCRNIKAAAAKLPVSLHSLHLDDCEFLHLVSAVDHDRNKTRRAIGKGLAVHADLASTDSLWQKLQVLRAVRMRGAR